MLSLQILEFIAFTFSIAGVILTIRQNILCWPAHLIGVICYLIFYFQTAYFATMLLQAFYIFMSLYGWYYWANAGKKTKSEVPVRLLKTKEIYILAVFIPLATIVVYYYLITYTISANPVFDSITSCLSLAGTWMMAKKILQHWLIWIATNFLYIYMFLSGGIYLTSLLYLFLVVLAIKGWYEWKKSFKTQNA